MGKPTGFPYQMHGAMTDVNVFSRLLSEEEVGDWARYIRDCDDTYRGVRELDVADTSTSCASNSNL